MPSASAPTLAAVLDEGRTPLTAVPDAAEAQRPTAGHAEIERRLHAAERGLAQAQARERDARAQAARLVVALERAECEGARAAALEAQLRRPQDAEYWLDVVQSLLSWRLTRQLRWLSRRCRPRPRPADGRR